MPCLTFRFGLGGTLVFEAAEALDDGTEADAAGFVGAGTCRAGVPVCREGADACLAEDTGCRTADDACREGDAGEACFEEACLLPALR